VAGGGGGTLLSLLGSWLLLTLARGRTRALAIAGRMTLDLERSERHTRKILHAAHDAFVSIDADGSITDWNPQAESLFGWSREQALGRELAATIIPEQHRAAHRRGIERFMQTGAGPALDRLLELTALHRDGREFPVELTISVVETDSGCSFNAFLRDITAQKLAETQLRRSSRYFELSRDLTVSLGFDGCFRSVNPAVADILGWSVEEIMARPYMDLVHPDDRAATRAEIEKLGGGHTTLSFVHRFLARDGSYRWLDWNAVLAPDEELMYASGRDITERTQMEQALRDAEQRFRTAFDCASIGAPRTMPRSTRVSPSWLPATSARSSSRSALCTAAATRCGR